MTAPGQEKKQEPAPEPKQAPGRLRRGQVVSYRHRDPILDVSYQDLGVVLSSGSDGEPVAIRPLAKLADVFVPPENVQPISTDDVPAGG